MHVAEYLKGVDTSLNAIFDRFKIDIGKFIEAFNSSEDVLKLKLRTTEKEIEDNFVEFRNKLGEN